jgi:predicted RNase H-like HicB family nuclease
MFARMESARASVRYRVAVHRARGCYFAQVIDLPGCFSRGATEVEAVENARSAIKAYQWMAEVLAGERAIVHVEIPV